MHSPACLLKDLERDWLQLNAIKHNSKEKGKHSNQLQIYLSKTKHKLADVALMTEALALATITNRQSGILPLLACLLIQ